MDLITGLSFTLIVENDTKVKDSHYTLLVDGEQFSYRKMLNKIPYVTNFYYNQGLTVFQICFFSPGCLWTEKISESVAINLKALFI